MFTTNKICQIVGRSMILWAAKFGKVVPELEKTINSLAFLDPPKFFMNPKELPPACECELAEVFVGILAKATLLVEALFVLGGAMMFPGLE